VNEILNVLCGDFVLGMPVLEAVIGGDRVGFVRVIIGEESFVGSVRTAGSETRATQRDQASTSEVKLDEPLHDAEDKHRIRRLGFVKNMYPSDTIAEATD